MRVVGVCMHNQASVRWNQRHPVFIFCFIKGLTWFYAMPKRVMPPLPPLEKGQVVWVYGRDIYYIVDSNIYNNGKVDAIFEGTVERSAYGKVDHVTNKTTLVYFIRFNNSGHPFSNLIHGHDIMTQPPEVSNQHIISAQQLPESAWKLRSVQFLL